MYDGEWSANAKKLVEDVTRPEISQAYYEATGNMNLSSHYTNDELRKMNIERSKGAPAMLRDDVVGIYSLVASLNKQLFDLSITFKSFRMIQLIISFAILFVLCDIQYSITQ